MKTFNVEVRFTPAHHAATNGAIEKRLQTIKISLKASLVARLRHFCSPTSLCQELVSSWESSWTSWSTSDKSANQDPSWTTAQNDCSSSSTNFHCCQPCWPHRNPSGQACIRQGWNHLVFKPDLKDHIPFSQDPAALQSQSDLVHLLMALHDFKPFIGTYARLHIFVKTIGEASAEA